jgi:hypothetical protein
MDKEPQPIPEDIAGITDTKLEDVLAGLSAPKNVQELREPKDKKIVTPAAPKKVAGLEQKLNEHFIAIALTVSAFDPVCGKTIADGSERLAQSWARLAAENSKVRKVLENLLQTGAWAEAIMSTATIAYPIMRHHNLVPEFTIPSFIHSVDSSGNSKPDSDYS